MIHFIQRCHTTYVTKYEPYQEEECKTQYKKSCYIISQKQTVQERVEVCRQGEERIYWERFEQAYTRTGSSNKLPIPN